MVIGPKGGELLVDNLSAGLADDVAEKCNRQVTHVLIHSGEIHRNGETVWPLHADDREVCFGYDHGATSEAPATS